MRSIQDDEDVGTLSRTKSPLAGMGMAQKIATVALALLALIAVIALLAGRGGSNSSTPSSTFTPASYSSSGAGDGANAGTGSSSTRSHAASSTRHRSSTVASDGLATIRVDDLPQQARETLTLIDAGGPFPYPRDGIVFSNFEHVLPAQARGWYHEYTVKTPGERDRGARRLIQGKDGTVYYTGDHYKTFKRVMR